MGIGSDLEQPEPAGRGAVELRVYRHGDLIERQRFESFDDAEAAAEAWADLEGHEFEIDDLSATHDQGDILEPDIGVVLDDERRSP